MRHTGIKTICAWCSKTMGDGGTHPKTEMGVCARCLDGKTTKEHNENMVSDENDAVLPVARKKTTKPNKGRPRKNSGL